MLSYGMRPLSSLLSLTSPGFDGWCVMLNAWEDKPGWTSLDLYLGERHMATFWHRPQDWDRDAMTPSRHLGRMAMRWATEYHAGGARRVRAEAVSGL